MPTMLRQRFIGACPNSL